jgi:hypothetical protein
VFLQREHHFPLQIGQDTSPSNQGSTKGKNAGLNLILIHLPKITEKNFSKNQIKWDKLILFFSSTTIHSNCQNEVS